MTEFLRFPKAVEYLVDQGFKDPMALAQTEAGRGRLLPYLPARFTIDMDARAVAGDLGNVATEGYLTFNIYTAHFNDGFNTASWNVVMDLQGKLHQFSPARSVDAVGRVHFCGLKNYDEDTLVMIQSANESAGGHAFKWNWRNDEYTRIGAGGSGHGTYGCHDIQFAHPGSAEHGEAFWAPGPNPSCAENNNVTLVEAATGKQIGGFETGFADCVADVNHAQLLEDDTSSILSLRAISAIAKYEIDKSGFGATRKWIIGGDEGNWPIVHGDVTYPPGATVWDGQHNAEYMGDNEVWMFDDKGMQNQSRLLIVKVNEDDNIAEIVWDYPLGLLAQVYGDCDPLPSGNILASYWRSTYGNKSAYDQTQCGVMEVTRETKEVAWHLRVFGRECPDEDCQLLWDKSGWTMYSVERFYEKPVLPSIQTPRVGATISPPSCAGGVLSFTAWNTFKVSSRREGHYSLLGRETGETLATGTFLFEAHWRPTNVTVAVDLISDTVETELVLQNNHGATTHFNMTCTKG